MSWRERMTKAKFKGFEFLTESHDTSYGRRLVEHSYPNSDQTDVEDFGLKATNFRLNAYFIGPDYDKEANGFLAKLAEGGAEWFNHPWLGAVWVRAKDWTRTERSDQNNYCTVTIEFVSGGRAPYLPKVDKVDEAIAKVAYGCRAVIRDFDLEPMSTDSIAGMVAEIDQHLEQVRKAIAVTTLPLQWANKAVAMVQGVKADLSALLSLPTDYANAIASIGNAIGAGDAGLSVLEGTRVRTVVRLTALASAPPAIVASSVTTPAFVRNRAAEAQLRATLWVLSAANVGLTQYATADARDTALNALLRAFDALVLVASDDVFDALLDARSAVLDALQSQDLTTVERMVVNPMPATVLAYQMGVAEDDLIAQNQINNPLFVQGLVHAG